MGSKEQKVFAVGIDLGTTFSSVCYIDEKMTPRMIQNYEGKNQTPSCVSFENNYTFVGDEAEERRHTHAPSTFYQVKRFIGKRKGDKVENEKWPFEVLQDAKKNLAFRVDDELMYPEQISALVLSKMKAIAEKYLRAAVTEAVITVPAHFDDLQRKATKRAAEIVGLKVLNILNEPTAAAIGYGYISASADSTRKRTILVYDLGGGTFDVSIVKMEGDRKAEVIASEGIMDLGGEDFDRLLFEEVTMQVADDNQQIKDSWEVLKKCREAKVKLSNAELAEIFITVQPNNEQKKIVFTRKLFNELCGGEIDKTMACVKEALKKAKIGKDDIDEVVMVGGSSRILYAQEMIQKFFEKKKLRCDTNIDETVSMGAAIMAHAMASDGERIILEDIVPFSLGVGVKNGIFDVIIPAYSKLGVEYKKVYQNAEDNQRQIIIKVYQGEAKTVAENKLLAELAIQLETFFVQPDGILKVTAKLLSTNEVKILEIKDVKNDQRTVEQLREKHIRRIARDEAEFERRCALNELDQAVRSLRRKAMRHTDAAEKSRLSKASTNESKWMQEHPTADIDTIQKRLQAINSYLK